VFNKNVYKSTIGLGHSNSYQVVSGFNMYTLRDWIPENKLSITLCRNPRAIDLLKKNPDKIYWGYLSGNPAAIDLLLANPDKIDWELLSGNPAAIDLLRANPNKIDWELLSGNPAAIDLLRANPNKISWDMLSANPSIFVLTRRSICEGPVDTKEWAWEYPREYLCLQAFRRRLMRAYLDPVYKLCRTRLNREFSSL
jgi:hypothetical protein